MSTPRSAVPAGVAATGSDRSNGVAGPTDLRPVSAPGAGLDELARRAGVLGNGAAPTSPDPDIHVSGVTLGSARVRPGDLFAALPGAHAHGARFADAARRAGAVAVLTDPDGAALIGADDAASTLVLDHPRGLVGPLAAAVYGDPTRRMAVAGVTGTSGKTTTTFLIRAGLAAAGREPGLIGTVGAYIGDERLIGGLTTPEAPDLQALFAVMAERGIADVAMEVSSHALALDRVEGTTFAVVAFTNLSQDHLEFHDGMRAYFEAKARLFDGRAARHVVVVDDEWGRELAARVGPDVVTVSTGDVSSDAAAGPTRDTAGAPTPVTWTAADIVTAPDGRTRFRAVGPRGAFEAGCAIPGRYNVTNVLVALAVLDAMGVPADVAAPAVAAAQVPGRMERIETDRDAHRGADRDVLVVVDYAHKPAAVDGALRALRPLTAGRLIIVLGCGGDRDRAKRPVMGRVAAELADVLIVTDDNPRSEDPATIRRAVLSGAATVDDGAEIVEIGDRAAAIAAAIGRAAPGDTVLVAGKGHETGQDVGGVVQPFDDRAMVRALLVDA